jgi:translation initiation factor 5A
MAEGEKKFVDVGSLKPGSYVLIDGFVCQVKTLEKSKPGKHGSAKARIVAFDIFTGSKKGLLKPTGAEAETPIITRGTGQVVAVMGDVVQVIDTTNYETFDTKKPAEVQGLASGAEVEYVKWGDSVKIVRKKGEKAE